MYTYHSYTHKHHANNTLYTNITTVYYTSYNTVQYVVYIVLIKPILAI